MLSVSKKSEGKTLYTDVQKIIVYLSIDYFKDCRSKLSCLGNIYGHKIQLSGEIAKSNVPTLIYKMCGFV
jgi:hypothetical protein